MASSDDVIFCVKSAFFEWKPFNDQILTEHLKSLSEDEVFQFQQKLAKETVDSWAFSKFPPKCSKFLRRLLLTLEENRVDVLDTFYNSLAKLDVKDKGFKSYFDGDRRICSLSETEEVISNGTTGLRTWAAGRFLYHWLKGKQIIRTNRTLHDMLHQGQIVLFACLRNFKMLPFISPSYLSLNSAP